VQQGRNDDAAREMEVALRLNPELKDARKELKRLTS
jgi:hypothetical protein